MKPIRKKRILILCTIVCIAIAAISLILFAMGNDLNHYYSLEQIANKEVPIEQNGIRIGGGSQ